MPNWQCIEYPTHKLWANARAGPRLRSGIWKCEKKTKQQFGGARSDRIESFCVCVCVFGNSVQTMLFLNEMKGAKHVAYRVVCNKIVRQVVITMVFLSLMLTFSLLFSFLFVPVRFFCAFISYVDIVADFQSQNILVDHSHTSRDRIGVPQNFSLCAYASLNVVVDRIFFFRKTYNYSWRMCCLS